MTLYWPFKSHIDYLLEYEQRFGGTPKNLVMSSRSLSDGVDAGRADGNFLIPDVLKGMTRVQRYQLMLNKMLPMLALQESSIRPVGLSPIVELRLESMNTLYEYIWECECRHTWRISPEALEFLANCSCECKTSEYLLPYDALVLTFPMGFTLPKTGLPLRSMLIGRIRSQMALGYAHDLIAELNQPRPVTFYSCDFGEHPGPDGKPMYTWDDSTPAIRSFVNVIDNESIEEFNMPAEFFTGGQYESESVREAVILASTLIWLAKAKPEFLKKEKVKSRPHIRHPRTVDCLTVPALYLGAIRRIRSEAQVKRDGPHWHVRPHMRGFSLRELRHERYSRNPDGSCKVILVEPYFVGEHRDETDSHNESQIKEVRL